MKCQGDDERHEASCDDGHHALQCGVPHVRFVGWSMMMVTATSAVRLAFMRWNRKHAVIARP